MESRLIQAEKLAAIGQAAASTAHEVRNALAGIAGTIEVLERSPAWRELPEDVGQEVKLQITRISHIIDDLLNYARPGTLSLRRSDLHQIIDKAIMATAAHPDSSGKRVVRRYAEGPIFLEVDPVRMEQAFQNLLTNAYQAMVAGDRLEIATAGAGGRITIRFTDTGAGMSEETIARALEPFYTTKAKGTGLGLAIVQAIVESHRGTIDLSSSSGSGTSVTLTLPDAGTIEGKLSSDPDRTAPVTRVSGGSDVTGRETRERRSGTGDRLPG
jgi:two-component system sensor histidine kinase HydH